MKKEYTSKEYLEDIFNLPIIDTHQMVVDFINKYHLSYFNHQPINNFTRRLK